MPWNDNLTGIALNIASTNQTPLRVMAGPGTGKSFAMKRRIARLLESGGDAERILAVTFTRTAAASLVDDLRDLGAPNCENVRASTLHAYCFSLLSSQAVFEYLGRKPRPIVTFTSSGVLRFEGHPVVQDLIIHGDFGKGRVCTKIIRAFEAAWARLQSDDPGWPESARDRQFQTALIAWLKFHEAMLIGELVPEALRYLRNNPTSSIRSAFDHVIVDEYQDLNRAEQDLLQLLAGQQSIAIVGDVDQPIYSFRHANPEGIEEYRQRHPTTHDEVLDQCRRCPKKVVTVAAHLIANNHTIGDLARLVSLPENKDGEINVIQWTNVDEEAQGIADYVRALVNSNRQIAPKDILILTPRRILGYKIRDRIEAHDINVHSFYHEEALEGVSAQRAFSLLALLANIEDRVSLRWWLGDGCKSARAKSYKVLREHCESVGISPYDALEQMRAGALTLSKAGDLLAKYKELVDLIRDLSGLSVNDLIQKLLPEGDEDCAVLREAALLAPSEVENAEGLFNHIKSSATQPEVPVDVDYVRVMSLHKSKGLTSKVAIVTGCSHGLIPFFNAVETAGEQAATLKEQRRLFYVAITRCTEILTISSVTRMENKLAYKIGAQIRFQYGQSGATVASRFLDELGPTAPAAIRGQDWVVSGFRL